MSGHGRCQTTCPVRTWRRTARPCCTWKATSSHALNDLMATSGNGCNSPLLVRSQYPEPSGVVAVRNIQRGLDLFHDAHPTFAIRVNVTRHPYSFNGVTTCCLSRSISVCVSGDSKSSQGLAGASTPEVACCALVAAGSALTARGRLLRCWLLERAENATVCFGSV